MEKLSSIDNTTLKVLNDSLNESIVKAMKKYNFQLYVTHSLATQHYVDLKAMINDQVKSISDPKCHVTGKDPFIYESLKFTLEGDILGKHQSLTNMNGYDVVETIKQWIAIKQATECLDNAIQKGTTFFDKAEVMGTITIPICTFGSSIKFYLWVDQTQDCFYFHKKTSEGTVSGYRSSFDYRIDLINTATKKYDSFSASDIVPSIHDIDTKSVIHEKDESENVKSSVQQQNDKSKKKVLQQISLF